MTIFLFGNTGMLGRYVYSYLKQEGHSVVKLGRDDGLDASTCDANDLYYMLDVAKGDVFINCTGVIPQRGDKTEHIFAAVNGSFPYALNDYCKKVGMHFLHVTTDCVFSGKSSLHTESSPHDATDIYGRSKSFGEPPTATIIRTSIVGEEFHNKKSLLEWLKSKKDQTIDGYVDHLWNGITCLQFAKLCKELIDKKLYWAGVRHVFSPGIFSKYEMATMISDVYDLNLTVNPKITGDKCDRTLATNYSTFKVPSFRTQLEEQRDFYDSLVK